MEYLNLLFFTDRDLGGDTKDKKKKLASGQIILMGKSTIC